MWSRQPGNTSEYEWRQPKISVLKRRVSYEELSFRAGKGRLRNIDVHSGVVEGTEK